MVKQDFSRSRRLRWMCLLACLFFAVGCGSSHEDVNNFTYNTSPAPTPTARVVYTPTLIDAPLHRCSIKPLIRRCCEPA